MNNLTKMSAAMLMLLSLSGCGSASRLVSTSKAKVSGTLEYQGGMAQSRSVLPGTVYFKDTAGSATSARTSPEGIFDIELLPGSYTVTGTSTKFQGGRAVCRTESDNVQVPAKGVSNLIVSCLIK